jgi:membrane protein
MTDDRLEARPGLDAEWPVEIPRHGWLQIARRAWKETKHDQVPLMSAGVAFFSFLSLFPAMLAAVMVYGLVADPQDVVDQAESFTAALPVEAASLVTNQMEVIAASPERSLGYGLALALALALWTASSAISNLITAVNHAYDEPETRNFVRRRLLALGFTLGAVIFVAVAVALIAVLPTILDDLVGDGAVRLLLEVTRWLGLLLAVLSALTILYRYAPDREAQEVRWTSIGTTIATTVWMLASVGFAVYVDNFGNYGETYGALSGVVVLLLWLWITAFVVLLGAEINAESERQTVQASRERQRAPSSS